jgi:hypothetical protein
MLVLVYGDSSEAGGVGQGVSQLVCFYYYQTECEAGRVGEGLSQLVRFYYYTSKANKLSVKQVEFERAYRTLRAQLVRFYY